MGSRPASAADSWKRSTRTVSVSWDSMSQYGPNRRAARARGGHWSRSSRDTLRGPISSWPSPGRDGISVARRASAVRSGAAMPTMASAHRVESRSARPPMAA